MSDQEPCNYCGGPTDFATSLDALGSEPGYHVWYCEVCKRYTWAKWRRTRQQQPHQER